MNDSGIKLHIDNSLILNMLKFPIIQGTAFEVVYAVIL